MSLDANFMEPSIRNLFLSTASGFSADYTSPATPMRGNAFTCSSVCINISASSTLTVYIDGSFDGVAWKTIANYTLTAFGYNSSSQTAVAYAFLRIRVNLAGTTVSSLSHHSLSFASL